MIRFLSCFALACAVFLPLKAVEVAAANPAVPESVDLAHQSLGQPWGADPLAQAALTASTASKAFLRPVANHGTRFPTVIELGTERAFTDGATWNLQLELRSQAALAKGTTVFVECFMRTVSTKNESGEGQTNLILEKSGAPFTKSLALNLLAPADGSWVRRTAGATIKEDYPAGGAQINFHLGFSHPQTIQLGGLRVVDLGPAVAPESLPRTRPTYLGQAPDATWRAGAAARIEQFRKNDVTVQVVDANGRPRAGATVQVAMTRPAFAFGSAVAMDMLVQEGDDGDRYRAWILQNCSRVVIENHLKMHQWQIGKIPTTGPAWNRETTLKGLAWLKDHDLPIKGHTLVWPSWRFSPKRLEALKADPTALKQEYDEHIVDILAATAPYQLVEWDVVNESFTQRNALDVLGDGVMASWFTLARQHFPSGGLFYNDFAHLTTSGMTPFKAHVEKVVQDLKAAGAPVTGLGIQAHMGEGMNAIPAVIAELERLGHLGVDLAITEFDVKVTDDAVQADFFRDFITACYADPKVTSFLAWGFWEGRHWIKEAAFIRKDWTPRPAAKVWNDLFKKAWWTDLSGTTNAAGSWQGRAFRGKHRITVTVAGKTLTKDVDIGAQPVTVEFR